MISYAQGFLVQQTTAEYLQKELDWKAVYFYDREPFGSPLQEMQ